MGGVVRRVTMSRPRSAFSFSGLSRANRTESIEPGKRHAEWVILDSSMWYGLA